MAHVLLVLAALFVSTYAANICRPAPKLDGRIVGGEDANIEDLPYQLSLEIFDSHSCGASIISAEWALTAAHCTLIFEESPEYLTLRAGSSKIEQGGSVHQAVEMIVHPNFDWETIDYDFALIRVANKFDIGHPGVQVVALADEEPQAEDNCTVSGWGSLFFERDDPNQLQKVEVPIVNRNICKEQYKNEFEITERMICAGLLEGGKDACQVDSGGPLVSNGRLVGIVSWGIGCAYPDYSGVYNNVAAQRDWIKSVSGV